MTTRLLAMMVLSSALTACQGHKANHERRQAPTGPGDVGIVMENASEADLSAILAEHPTAQVRRLNPNHGLYEVFGVSLGDVRRLAPSVRASNNEFFNFRPMSVPGPAGMDVEGLARCADGEGNFPTAVASVSEPAGVAQTFALEHGRPVRVSAAQSKPHEAHPSALKSALVLIPPGASALGQQINHSGEIEVQPDALGVYQVYLVVQDARNVCALDAVRFVVTANRPYLNVAESGQLDLDQIPHLKAVGAQESWLKSQGEGITIAVIDTGVNYNHPLLSHNMLINALESDNGQDDDGNGFADDGLGYDFVNQDGLPYDDDGHGTHVAGLAAARQIGMAQKAKILAVKALTTIGGDVASIAAAVVYAVDRGAKVINMSLGTMSPAAHPLIVRSMDYAKERGALVVVAAGNGDPRTGLGFDIDQIPVYPAALKHENILSVAASGSTSPLTPYSNFGKNSVDVTAPGGFGMEPIISCAYENPAGDSLAAMSGTSMATPIVAGIAAQVWSLDPSLSPVQVKELLMKAGTEDATLKDVTVSGRHLNALTAVNLAGPSNLLF